MRDKQILSVAQTIGLLLALIGIGIIVDLLGWFH